MIQHAILSVILAVFIGEFIKLLLQARKKEHLRAFHLGGMPSTHASAVAALILAVFLETKFSLLFLVCVVIGWIVIRDAYGVRWEASQHSVALNKLLKTKDYQLVGHTKREVMAGVALGIVATLAVYFL